MEAPSLAAFKNLVNLAGQDLGTQVVFANDDFFAEKENLIKPEEPIFLPDEYTERGKWMDGWESRRKRELGFDRCVIKLGLPGTIKAVNIDTRHFLGNHPAFASGGCGKDRYPIGERHFRRRKIMGRDFTASAFVARQSQPFCH